ncbi:hypothetical protein HNE_3490 [Hyphomonas neptunium ATCC 15444]|uniref:Uncharacterized protein n=2 Tax=Hyphomonas TaxID=85 RepID=Q0BWI2_HYPNA|nr:MULTISPECIES: hypothetical protein [Hyphomonas]ABI77576.1 hypothetical protein HNE_3490 [Hyphomonas neptunium ATCC 15444]KCZ94737.1 hypothetical protein HHI_08083 [Hyphomonas hirschiana VP5]
MLQEPLKPAERGDAPFRARLRARDGMRPQSTLAILAGYEPKDGEGADVLARERPARPIAAISSAAAVPQARPEPRRIPPAGRPEAWAPPAKPELRPEPIRPREEIRKAPVVIVPPVEEAPETDAEEDERATGLGRFGEYSQLAFAGLAVLGLAGLSLLAIDSALKGKPGTLPDDGEDANRRTAADPGPAVLPASVSAVAVQEAAMPAGADVQPWFDYRGVADYLKSRVDAFEASERDAARRQQAEAQRLASTAIADAEAGRLAAAAQAEADALAARDAAIDAERQRLARQEAERIANEEAARLAAQAEADAAARAEADRLARMEADRAAAALADQRRVAELEAERAATAEAKRLAEIESRRVAAEAEAKRLAEIEARKAAAQAEQQRLADLAAKRAAEDEARRLAALDARRAGDAAEARRLADLEAKRLANLEARTQAVQKPEPGTLTLAAATVAPAPPALKPAAPPSAASLKPRVQPVVSADPAPVTRAAPTILTARPPEVRPFRVGPAAAMRGADVFLGERVALTSGDAISADAMASLQKEFIRLVATSPDGTRHALTTPDGRSVEVSFERTQLVAAGEANVRTVGYSADAPAPITRGYAEQPVVNVSVMCRDVAYAIPGQERGRFSACQGADGQWMLARQTEALSQGAI